jgi:DNA-directed RNA polymerase specialized sigma24 family protein
VADDQDELAASLRNRVTALADSLTGILDLDPLAAARSAPRLIDEAKSVMAAVRKAAIAEAARSMTHAEIADGLGVSPSAVNNALVEHRAHILRPARVTVSSGQKGNVGV